MKNNNTRITIISGSIFLLLLIISLVFFFFISERSTGRVLYFSNESTGNIAGESRRISNRSTEEDNIREVINELILGPAEISNTRVIPRETKLKSVLLRDDILYIDFTTDIIFEEKGVSMNFPEIIDNIRRTIRFNFPKIKEITVFIEGELPFSVSGSQR